MKKKMGKIYMATSSSGKMYIGQTTDSLHNRKRKHKNDSKKFTYAFANAVNKYGINGFEWNIIEDGIPADKLNEKEQYYIKKFDTYSTGYNSTEGGDFNPMMYQELRDKVSMARRGKPSTVEQRGEKNHQAKLNWKIVNEMRKIYAETDKTMKEIADEYNVSRGTVRNVVRNTGWINDKYVVPDIDKRKTRTKENEIEIVNEYKTGKHSSLTLSKKYGLSFQVICDILNKYIDDDIRRIKEANIRRSRHQKSKVK